MKKYEFEPISKIQHKFSKTLNPLTAGYSDLQLIEKDNECSLEEAKPAEEDLIKIKQESYQKGYLEGKLDAEKDLKELEIKRLDLFERIENHLNEINSKSIKLEEQIVDNLTLLSYHLVKKIIGNDYLSHKKEFIKDKITEILAKLSTPQEVNITIPKTSDQEIKKYIKNIIDKSSIKINLIENQEITESDCIIDWKDGKIEINKGKMMQELDKIYSLTLESSIKS